MAKRVLVFTAHPDDFEIGCSGTCKKLQTQGYEIVSIVTVRPSAETNNNRSKEIVNGELTHSYNISKFRLKVFNTDLHSNGRPNLAVNNNTITSLSTLMEDCEIAILPNPEDYHQDHSNTYKLAYPLVKNVQQVWCMHSWPYCLHYTQSRPNLYVDITNQWQFKQSLLNCYTSYITDENIKQIKKVNQYAGLNPGVELAEAFTILHQYD